MSSKLSRALVAVILALGSAAALSEPAVAAPVCDVPNPPPVCDDPVDDPDVSLTVSTERVPAGVQVKGNARDLDATGPIQVVVRIAGVEAGRFGVTSGVAFVRTVPALPGDTVCVTAVNQGVGADRTVCRSKQIRFEPFGVFDELSPGPSGLHVRGWAIDPDTASPIAVQVRVNGRLLYRPVASVTRTDVAAAHPAYGSDHGFDFFVPAARGTHTVCLRAINVGQGVDVDLPCRTVTQGGAPYIDFFAVRAPDYPTPRLEVDVRVSTRDSGQISVRRGPSPNGPWTDWPNPHLSFDPAGFWEIDLTVAWGTTYCYLATTTNAYGSYTAPPVCTATFAGAHPQPANVSATSVSTNSMMLNWDDVATGEDEWRVVRSGVPDAVFAGTPRTGRMGHLVTGLQPDTLYCFLIGARSPGWAGNPYFFCQSTAKSPPEPGQRQGVRNFDLWNCDSLKRDGAVWMTDASGRWVRLGALPNSLRSGSCGPASSLPSLTVTPPDQSSVSVVVVVVDGRYCLSEDPYNANCRAWQTWTTGDSRGITERRLLLR